MSTPLSARPQGLDENLPSKVYNRLLPPDVLLDLEEKVRGLAALQEPVGEAIAMAHNYGINSDVLIRLGSDLRKVEDHHLNYIALHTFAALVLIFIETGESFVCEPQTPTVGNGLVFNEDLFEKLIQAYGAYLGQRNSPDIAHSKRRVHRMTLQAALERDIPDEEDEDRLPIDFDYQLEGRDVPYLQTLALLIEGWVKKEGASAGVLRKEKSSIGYLKASVGAAAFLALGVGVGAGTMEYAHRFNQTPHPGRLDGVSLYYPCYLAPGMEEAQPVRSIADVITRAQAQELVGERVTLDPYNRENWAYELAPLSFDTRLYYPKEDGGFWPSELSNIDTGAFTRIDLSKDERGLIYAFTTGDYQGLRDDLPEEEQHADGDYFVSYFLVQKDGTFDNPCPKGDWSQVSAGSANQVSFAMQVATLRDTRFY